MPPVHKWLERLATCHDLLRLNSFQRMRVGIREDEQRMVHLFDESAQILRREKPYLLVTGPLIEVTREALVPALVALLIIRCIVADDVPAGIDNRIAHRIVERLCTFGRRDAHHVPFLYSFSTTECEIDKHLRVLLEDLAVRRVCHVE